MRDRDRTAVLDLAQERRHHAAAAAQHIAEPHRDEVPIVRARRVLDDALGDALRRAHHVRRAHRLVRRDQHEVLRAAGDRGVDDVARALHVVRDRFADVFFHQRHMFVRRGVEDRIWLVLVENSTHALPVADVGDDRH